MYQHYHAKSVVRKTVQTSHSRVSHVPRATESTAVAATDSAPLYKALDDACVAFWKSPRSQKLEFSSDVLVAYQELKTAGCFKKWGIAVDDYTPRRNMFQGELRQVGIKSPENIAKPSIRNDAAFLATVVGVCSVLAVAAMFLPGDWGYFSSYLIGSVVLVVLAIGSTAPGLLAVVIDKFSQVYPDYKERVARHEAGHFLMGYLVGVPVTGYSMEIGLQHTEFAEAKLQHRIVEKKLDDKEIDLLSMMAVGGVAAEGRQYEEVLGQTADLFDLQRMLLRSSVKLSDQQQQNVTRWAVYAAASLLKKYQKEHEVLTQELLRGSSVLECVKAIENC